MLLDYLGWPNIIMWLFKTGEPFLSRVRGACEYRKKGQNEVTLLDLKMGEEGHQPRVISHNLWSYPKVLFELESKNTWIFIFAYLCKE